MKIYMSHHENCGHRKQKTEFKSHRTTTYNSHTTKHKRLFLVRREIQIVSNFEHIDDDYKGKGTYILPFVNL